MEKFRLKPSRPPKLDENDVERACIDLLRIRGYYVIRLQSGLFKTPDGKRWTRIGEPGLPDYVAIHAMYPAFFMETKRPGAKTSPEQQRKHWELTAAYHLTVTTVDHVEALTPWLNGFEAMVRGKWAKGIDDARTKNMGTVL